MLNTSKTKTMIVSPLTIDGIMLKKSDDLNIFRAIFDSKMLSALCSVRFGVRVCSWYSAANTYRKLLCGVVNGACFITGCVFECNFAHRRSVALLCMLFKIQCNPMRPLEGAIYTCALCSNAGYLQCLVCISV